MSIDVNRWAASDVIDRYKYLEEASMIIAPPTARSEPEISPRGATVNRISTRGHRLDEGDAHHGVSDAEAVPA
ncbi:hypothetical protein [Nocardia anaemiae]|uniref:hypothetical protein n=1 Tax=Nocardia anaemiae TaxID=263910 RepID=UPI0007A50463|nr:hypothetical protein [Nocardia anaemiae]